jgi:hypothetical protein
MPVHYIYNGRKFKVYCPNLKTVKAFVLDFNGKLYWCTSVKEAFNKAQKFIKQEA